MMLEAHVPLTGSNYVGRTLSYRQFTAAFSVSLNYMHIMCSTRTVCIDYLLVIDYVMLPSHSYKKCMHVDGNQI